MQLLTGILFLGLWQSSAQAMATLTLSWNQNLDADIAGYKLYYGTSSRAYTDTVDTGSETSATTVNLVEGVTYYFAVTAYTSAGLESDFSDEFMYLVPMPVSQLEMALGSNGAPILRVTSSAGGSYEIEATEDLKTWTVIGTVGVAAGGSSDFTDTNASAFSKRFYRTIEVQP